MEYFLVFLKYFNVVILEEIYLWKINIKKLKCNLLVR